MDEALRARFLPRFIATAKERLGTLASLMGDRDAAATPAAVRGEFHSLAGEASMLGLHELGESARLAERAAVRWQEGDKSAVMACVRALRPLSKAVAALETSLQAPPDPAPATVERDTSVLVVDDSLINADAVVDALETAGLSATAASDRDSLGASLDGPEGTPSLMLVDVYMPELPLAEVIATGRAAGVAAIILLSGLPVEELQSLASEVGADGAVSKAGGVEPVVATVVAALAGLKTATAAR